MSLLELSEIDHTEKLLLIKAIKEKPNSFTREGPIKTICSLCGNESENIFYTAYYRISNPRNEELLRRNVAIDCDCYYTLKDNHISFPA